MYIGVFMAPSAVRRPPGLHCLPRSAEQWKQRLATDASRTLAEMLRGCELPVADASARAAPDSFFDCAQRMAVPPGHLTPQKALEEFGCGCNYLGDSSPAVPLDESLLSLPEAGAAPKPLEALLGSLGFEEVQGWLDKNVLPNSVAQSNIEAMGGRCYHDRGLQRSPRRYRRLVERLHRAGMVRFSDSCESQVGVFAVAKKNGKQRMVIDCRVANCHFTPSQPVSLPTSGGLSQMRLDAGREVHIGHFDLRDAFYQIGLPAELQP